MTEPITERLPRTEPRRAAAPDISDYKMETIREGRSDKKPRRDWGTDLLLVALCMIVSLVGGFVGTVLGNAW
jgi:hypothetical protein